MFCGFRGSYKGEIGYYALKMLFWMVFIESAGLEGFEAPRKEN